MSEENKDNEFPQGEHGAVHAGEEQLESSRPAVAAAPGKLLVVVIFALLFIGIVIKSLFFSSSPPPVPENKKQVIQEAANPASITQEGLPSLPTNQQPVMPPPVEPPPQVLPPPEPPPEITTKGGPTNEQLNARVHAPMLTGAGLSAANLTSSDNQKKKPVSTDPNTAFEQSVSENSSETVEATRIKNLNITIAQGKFIHGVLETAIDSTLPGNVRAIVSHDIYAESGKSILVPKGSRIVGVYNSSVRRGQARVFIIWTRIIRPDGIDVAINSPGVDSLGRSGMGGDVDNKYLEAFSTAILTSSLDIGVAAIGDALFGSQQQTTTTGPNGGSSTTTSSSPTATAMQTAVQNLGSVGQSIVNSTVNLAPTIHIDQGEIINIFVNKDVVFPYGLSSEMGFVP